LDFGYGNYGELFKHLLPGDNPAPGTFKVLLARADIRQGFLTNFNVKRLKEGLKNFVL
jgi:hypothetical protein